MLFGYIRFNKITRAAMVLAACLLGVTGCKDKSNTAVTLNEPFDGQIVTQGKGLTVSLGAPADFKPAGVVYFIDGKQAKETSGYEVVTLDTKDMALGEHTLAVLVKGGTDTLKGKFILRSGVKPEQYGYRIINTYPHDPEAYTQGLELHGGRFLEGTGEYGTSTIRWVDVKSGKVLQQSSLDKKYFGEGLTLINGKVAWLTWKENVGFIYNPQTLKQEGTFSYNNSAEGWGLTNDGEKVYKSDGTNSIYILNKDTFKEQGAFSVYNAETGDVAMLNELEYANGSIYANVYEQNIIVRIDPKSGAVTAVINMEGLLPPDYFKTEDARLNNVLNGIAYDKATGHFYVTGKKWPHMYEVEFVKK